jgi:hypothetical protein
MQALDMERRFRALDQVEKREMTSLETALRKERRVRSRARDGHAHMPALTLELKPPGRRALVQKAINRHMVQVPKETPERETKPAAIDLKEAFEQAARNENENASSGETGSNDDRGVRPISGTRARRLRRHLLKEFDQAANPPDGHADGGGDGPGHSRTPKKENELGVRRRRRRRDRDRGRER